MSTRFAKANGINIAYRVQGEGPPLVLIMGYRLNSSAWPATFIEQLARQFTVITLDNRGTGLSDKPVEGYAIANMARDVRGVLDELAIAEVSMLGYSMGGAIAQEFVRQFPERVSRLILCATLAGGPQATYARSSVVSVMRDLDDLSPEQAARRIWKVTYAPGYLERHRTLAEDQMRREIARPTPLHAADLQFQAFAEFDGSDALAEIRCPTLVLTGDRDELIPPQNSLMMSTLIPNAKLAVIPGGGHRVLWEATEICVDLITRFLLAIDAEPAALLSSAVNSRTPANGIAPPDLGDRPVRDMAVRTRKSRLRIVRRRAAVDYDRKRVTFWRWQADRPDAAVPWQRFRAPAALALAEGSWLSAGDGRSFPQSRGFTQRAVAFAGHPRDRTTRRAESRPDDAFLGDVRGAAYGGFAPRVDLRCCDLRSSAQTGHPRRPYAFRCIGVVGVARHDRIATTSAKHRYRID